MSPLKSLLSKIPVWESRISFGDWVLRAAVAVVASGATFMTWLDGVVQPWGLGRLGYVAVFLLVALCCSLVLLLVARATYYFRSGSRRQDGQKEGDAVAQRSADSSPGVARTVNFCASGLYIGNIDIDHRLVDETRVLTIMVSGFNASGCSIDIREVRGTIVAKVKKLAYRPSATFEDELDFGDMLNPSIGRWLCDLADIQNLSEFFFKIIQSVPANMLNELQETDWQRRITLDFTKLDVMVYPAANGDSAACRLPLWGGATFHLSSAEWVKVHKVVVVAPQAAGAGL